MGFSKRLKAFIRNLAEMGLKGALFGRERNKVKSTSMRPPVVKLRFRFTRWLLLQSLIELAASLNVRPVFASNELLSVLASFCQTPNALFAQRRFGKRRGTRRRNDSCYVFDGEHSRLN